MPTLIDHDRKFIFIHVPRTGGTSITRTLSGFKIRPPEGLVSLGHCTIGEAVHWLTPEQFSSYLKFAVVRNPWDWFVSNYLFARSNPQHFMFNWLIGKSFAQFVQCWDELKPLARVQSEYLFAANGGDVLDKVCRFESLAEDFGWVARAFYLTLPLDRENSVPHKPYRDYYTPATRDLVARHCAKEIAKFSYEF